MGKPSFWSAKNIQTKDKSLAFEYFDIRSYATSL